MNEEREELIRQVAEVEWIDTHSKHGWGDEVPSAGQIRSIGYVLRDDEREVVLTESIDLVPKSSPYGCSTAIPRSAILKVKYLRGKSR